MSVPPLKTLFGNIANAIRSKKGTNASIVASDFPQEILSIPTGGGGTPPPITRSMPIITWIYRDKVTGKNTVVRTNVAKGGNAIPPSDVGNVQANAGENPALTFQGWNHSSQEMQNVQTDMCIGAMYITTDGWTYFYIDLNAATGLTHVINLRSTAGNTVTIEWMDGTANSTFTGVGAAINKTWVGYGRKIFRARVTNGTEELLLGGGTAMMPVIGTNVTKNRQAMKKAFIGEKTQLRQSSFVYAGLTDISIPQGVTEIPVESIAGSFIETVVIPSGVTEFALNALNADRRLIDVSIPSSVTTLYTSAFRYCSYMTEIVLPGGITSIGATAFDGCTSIETYILKALIPPTLTDVNAFSGIHSACKIFVPDSSLNNYKKATNWVTYANYIYPMSELTA